MNKIKSFFAFRYKVSQNGTEMSLLVYADSKEQAEAKAIERLDRSYPGGCILMNRVKAFVDMSDADQNMGPGRSLLTSLSPDDKREFLSDYQAAEPVAYAPWDKPKRKSRLERELDAEIDLLAIQRC